MPETYTVEAAEHKTSKPDTGYGPMQVISLALKAGDGTVKRAEWFTKASTVVPQPGVQLVGEVSEGQYGLRFKKVASAASGWSRPEDPKRAARIQRMHSQEMALKAMSLRFEPGDMWAMQPDEFFILVKRAADWFDKDAEAAGERA